MTYDKFGDNDVLRLREDAPMPKVGPSQVRVRVTRASINPVDWKLMAGGLDAVLEAHFPVIAGWDVAGVVDEVGPDTPEFTPGERVAAYARKPTLGAGTFAEYVTVPVDFLARIPEGVSDDIAGALPLTGLTAKRSIDALDLRARETVLLHGASGGVGFIAAQLARRTGARVIGSASAANADKLRRVGAHHVEYGEGLVDAVRELAPEGVDAVADFAGEVVDQSLALLKDPARQVSITDPGVTEQGGRWIWVRPDGEGLGELLGLIASGELEIDIDRVLPLAEVAQGFAASRSGKAQGKIVIDVTR